MKKFVFVLLVGFLFSFCSCVLPKISTSPCVVCGEPGLCFLENSSVVFCFSVENKLSKSVTGADFILSLFDEDGEPVFKTDWVKFRLFLENEPLDGYEIREFCINLDEYFDADIENDASYIVDYFYTSRIEYEDGSVIEDPFGRWCE